MRTPSLESFAAFARVAVKRLVPERSALYPLLRDAYRALGGLPATIVDLGTARCTLADVRDRDRWLRFLDVHRCPPWRADAEAGLEGAAGLVIDLAMAHGSRFPRALSDGIDGSFARWVLGEATPELGPRAVANVRAVFRSPPGNRVLWAYDTDLRQHALHPLALTPPGRVAYLRWILNRRRRRAFGLAAHHVVWFALASAEDETLGLVPTWLRNPDWQRRTPEGLAAGYAALSAWASEVLGVAPLPTDLPAHWAASGLAASWRKRMPAEPITGVNVLGHVSFESGLGEAARNTIQAARIAGLEVSMRDVAAPDSPRVYGLEPHPVTLVHLPGGNATEHAYRDACLWRRPGVHRIGVWYWELDRAPAQWRSQGAYLDEIWCPTTFIADAVRHVTAVPTLPMFPGIAMPRFEARTRDHFGLPQDRFLFLFMFDMFSYFERKNPLAVIRAFRRAFAGREPVGLVIKVSRGANNPRALSALRREAAGGDVTVIDRVLAREDSYALMDSCDAYVSLHRSEGFGLTMAEAMALGKPVIATGYSGNLDFMTRDVGCLVDYRLVSLSRDIGPYPAGGRWAEPDVDEAARWMRWVHEDRDGARAMGERARVAIRSRLSLDAYARRISERLRQIASGDAN